MQSSPVTILDHGEIRQWIIDRFTLEKVEELLQNRGLDAETISSHLKEFNRLRYEKRRSKGFICASVGALLGFIGCVLAILNPMPELYNMGLYGFTSLAAVLIMTGLYFLFE